MLEGLLRGLNDRSTQRLDTEGRAQVAELSDLSGEGFRSHGLNGT
jgi:hypothetical protein